MGTKLRKTKFGEVGGVLSVKIMETLAMATLEFNDEETANKAISTFSGELCRNSDRGMEIELDS